MIKLFCEKPINELFRRVDESIILELNRFVNIETADTEKFSETIFQNLKISVLKLKLDEIKVIPAMEARNGSSFPAQNLTSPNKNYQVAVITYCIPYIGNPELFSYQPSNYSTITYNCFIEDSNLCFKIATEYGDINLSEEVRRNVFNESQTIIEWTKKTLNDLNNDCLAYNATLKSKIQVEIERRKKTINDLKNLGDQLNPMK